MNTLQDHKLILTYVDEPNDILFNYIHNIFKGIENKGVSHIDDYGMKEITYILPSLNSDILYKHIENILEYAYLKDIHLKSQLYTRTYSARIEIPTENILSNITNYQKNLIELLSQYKSKSFRPVPYEQGYSFIFNFPFSDDYPEIIEDIKTQTMIDLHSKAIVILDWNDILDITNDSLEEKKKIIFK